MKTKRTIAASNWTGNQVEVEVDGFTFELYDYTFKLEESLVIPDDGDGLGGFTCYKIRGNEWPQDYSLGEVGRWGMDRQWEATNGAFNREGDDPVEAAVKLLCNII